MKTKLEINKTYLFNSGVVNENIHEMTVLFVGKKSIKFNYHRTDGTSYFLWITKKEFEDKYKLIEELPETYQSPIHYTPLDFKYTYHDTKINLIDCPTCGGEGSVPAENSTIPETICPKCFGAKKIIP
ncbi:MAG: hypothetical protein ACOC33_03555 [bacterium]